MIKILIFLLLFLPTLAFGQGWDEARIVSTQSGFHEPQCYEPSIPWQEARLNVGIIGGGVPAAAGGPDAWYGPTPNNATYTGSTPVIFCERITITVGGSLTKISLGVSDSKGSSNIKMALYNSDGTTRLSTGGEILNAAIVESAYNDYTLGTPVSVTTSQVVTACFINSADMNYYVRDEVTSDGQYQSGVAYASFPPATLSTSSAEDKHMGLRVYVD